MLTTILSHPIDQMNVHSYLTPCAFVNNLNFLFSQDYETSVTTERPRPPIITVVVSSPVIQIIDVGETVQLPCTAFHNIKRVWSILAYSLKIAGIKSTQTILNFTDSNHSILAQRIRSTSSPIIPRTWRSYNHKCSTCWQRCLCMSSWNWRTFRATCHNHSRW